MGFGTSNQLGNRTGVTNQTSLADLFGGVSNSPQQSQGFGGGQNQLFSLLQQLLGGGGGFQAGPNTLNPGGGGFNRGAPPVGIDPVMGPSTGINPILNPSPGSLPDIGGGFDGGSPAVGNLLPGGDFAPRPPIGLPSFGRGGEGGFISPPGGGTPITSLSNPFAQLINQRALR